MNDEKETYKKATSTSTLTSTSITPISIKKKNIEKKVDKCVCTNETYADLQRSLTYEIIFSSLLEKKMQAMKKDCEENKRLKRMKKKSIGRIFCHKRFFGSRKNLNTQLESQIETQTEQSHYNTAKTNINEIVEISSANTTSQASVCTVKQPIADSPASSSLSNTTSSKQITPCNLLVQAQTHTPAVQTSSSSSDIQPASNFDTTSLGNGGRVHTSTMAEYSLSSLQQSLESLSRCTVSFGGTEIIPTDTASLLYERVHAARRLRILEAKSISAQCSPILARQEIKLKPTTTKTKTTTTTSTTTPATNVNKVSTLAVNRLQPQGSIVADYSRNISRQNTSEDSANVTLSTLLNQSDSLSCYCSSNAVGTLLTLSDRFKSKSAGVLMVNRAIMLQQSDINTNIDKPIALNVVDNSVETSNVETTKLNRITSTSMAKQNMRPNIIPSGQSGSDDEYRKRKRKYSMLII